ncbi:MAG TPA: hypothetical protein VIL86_09890 [Tepidisphaeraceae bacterium]|jgi:hypothetical protein
MTPYNATIEKATIDPLSRLNPRRRLLAEALLERLEWRGGKLFLTPQELRDFTTAQAADDLFALGLADIRLAGAIVVLALVEGGWR